mgnify:CR=1 FL=1
MENYLREIVDYGVLGLLGLMSVVSLGIVFERLFFYASLRPEVLQLYKHKNHLELELSRNLTLLATIASNAPYVGLLGTVFGIMLTFVDIGSKGGASDAQRLRSRQRHLGCLSRFLRFFATTFCCAKAR